MFIGDGAKLVRDAFELAKEKCKDQEKVSTLSVFLLLKQYLIIVN